MIRKSTIEIQTRYIKANKLNMLPLTRWTSRVEWIFKQHEKALRSLMILIVNSMTKFSASEVNVFE